MLKNWLGGVGAYCHLVNTAEANEVRIEMCFCDVLRASAVKWL